MNQNNEALVRVHGVSPGHTPEQGVAVGNAVLIAVGAGGPLSAEEMAEFLSIATEYGAPPDAIDGWKRFDYAGGKVSEHLQLDPRLARHLLYEALRICHADAASAPAEKKAGVARALGVDPGELATLEAVMTAEGALSQARLAMSEAAGKLPEGKPTPPTMTAGLAAIAQKEGQLRAMRIAVMDSGKPG